jgi:hypothetical protein
MRAARERKDSHTEGSTTTSKKTSATVLGCFLVLWEVFEGKMCRSQNKSPFGLPACLAKKAESSPQPNTTIVLLTYEFD